MRVKPPNNSFTKKIAIKNETDIRMRSNKAVETLTKNDFKVIIHFIRQMYLNANTICACSVF
jgi:hypothetical protein